MTKARFSKTEVKRMLEAATESGLRDNFTISVGPDGALVLTALPDDKLVDPEIEAFFNQ